MIKLYFCRSSLILLLTTLSQLVLGGTFADIEILKEGPQVYNFLDVREGNLPFETYKPQDHIKKKSSYWLKFEYRNTDVRSSNYLLALHFIYQRLDLYYYLNDSLCHYRSGISLDFNQRNLFFPTLYLKLPTSRQPTVCWLHVDGFLYHSFSFAESTIDDIVKREVLESNLAFFLIGLSFLGILFSLALFVYLKEKLYLYYSMFSIMVIMSQLTFSGYIYHYTNNIYQFTSLQSVYNLYAITYAGINIALLFYYMEYFKFYTRSKRYKMIFYGLASLRVTFLLIHIFNAIPFIERWVDSRILDLIIQFFIIICITKTPRKYFRPAMFAMVSVLILITGNLLYILQEWGIFNLGIRSYASFINLAGLEVIVFAISIAYRNFFLRKEHDKAVNLMVENLKASEELKDNLNRELEKKVFERTEEIRKLNEALQSHNIELKSEVVNVYEARIFQEVMNFKDFQRIFADDEACYTFLAKLKWKPDEKHECKKCGYKILTMTENYKKRCRKCGYIESATTGTIFQHLKFPILKAFYITYRTSLGKKDDATFTEMAEEIDLRKATVWTFKQKVMELIEATRTKKKHKDGWTHLIEYSMERKNKASF